MDRAVVAWERTINKQKPVSPYSKWSVRSRYGSAEAAMFASIAAVHFKAFFKRGAASVESQRITEPAAIGDVLKNRRKIYAYCQNSPEAEKNKCNTCAENQNAL